MGYTNKHVQLVSASDVNMSWDAVSLFMGLFSFSNGKSQFSRLLPCFFLFVFFVIHYEKG